MLSIGERCVAVVHPQCCAVDYFLHRWVLGPGAGITGQECALTIRHILGQVRWKLTAGSSDGKGEREA